VRDLQLGQAAHAVLQVQPRGHDVRVTGQPQIGDRHDARLLEQAVADRHREVRRRLLDHHASDRPWRIPVDAGQHGASDRTPAH